MFAVRCVLIVVGCCLVFAVLLCVACNSLVDVRCVSVVVCWVLFAVCCVLCAVCCVLCGVCCLLVIDCCMVCVVCCVLFLVLWIFARFVVRCVMFAGC